MKSRRVQASQDDAREWSKGGDLWSLLAFTLKGIRLNDYLSVVFWLSEKVQHSVGPPDVREKKIEEGKKNVGQCASLLPVTLIKPHNENQPGEIKAGLISRL